MQKQQSKKYFLLILLIAVLVVPSFILAAWWNPFSWNILNNIFHKQTTPIACTMEAKICPDGSSVGRTGPKCEFPTCLADPTTNWKTYISETYDINIKYPANWKIDETIRGIDLYSFDNKGNYYSTGSQPKGESAINISFNELTNKNLSTIEWCEKFVLSEVDTDALFSKENSLKIDSYNAAILYYKSKLSSDISGEVACIITDTKGISIISAPLISAKQINDFNQIISTFKFTAPMVTTKEQACLSSGGTIRTIDCYCSGGTDFMNNCAIAIGGCTCNPADGVDNKLKSCDCGQGKCFDGEKCVILSH